MSELIWRKESTRVAGKPLDNPHNIESEEAAKALENLATVLVFVSQKDQGKNSLWGKVERP
jgi:hypothetical protein